MFLIKKVKKNFYCFNYSHNISTVIYSTFLFVFFFPLSYVDVNEQIIVLSVGHASSACISDGWAGLITTSLLSHSRMLLFSALFFLNWRIKLNGGSCHGEQCKAFCCWEWQSGICKRGEIKRWERGREGGMKWLFKDQRVKMSENWHKYDLSCGTVGCVCMCVCVEWWCVCYLTSHLWTVCRYFLSIGCSHTGSWHITCLQRIFICIYISKLYECIREVERG